MMVHDPILYVVGSVIGVVFAAAAWLWAINRQLQRGTHHGME